MIFIVFFMLKLKLLHMRIDTNRNETNNLDISPLYRYYVFEQIQF